jgi:hypothetical protein
MSIPPAGTEYMFRGQTIGPSGNVLYDGLNVPEMMFAMQKKFLGIPGTMPDTLYVSEYYPNIGANIPNAFPFIHQKKLYAQTVPLPNPMIDSSFQLISSKVRRDPTFVNSNYPPFFEFTLCNDTLSSRWVSNDFPYISFYSNVLLTSIYNLDNNPTSLYSNFATTYWHPLLINSISGRYDISYVIRLNTYDTSAEYLESDGYWQLDNDTGIVMFFDSNTTQSQVTASRPPRISFFRYEGLFGEAGITEGQYL